MNCLASVFSILISFLAFQIHVAPILAYSIDLDQRYHIGGIAGFCIYDENTKCAFVEGGQVGLIPYVGEIFDGANAAIYFARGDNFSGGLSLAAMIPIGGQAVTAGKWIGKWSSKYILKNWYKGTFPNKTQSISYHLAKHGKGRTARQYTQDAMNFFNKNKGLGQNVILKDGTQGIKIQTKQIINGKTHRVGGHWTKDGRLVTFWD